MLLLFVSLIVHEFGHALVARRQGIGVDQIDLYLFGGLTRMNRDAATPGEDFKVSAAGPLATLGVILVCLAVDLAIVGPHRLTHAIALDQDITITPVLLSLSWLLPMNVLLLVFNLMPAYPLDGGRIARSIIWRVTGSKRTGTIISARMGQGLSLVLAAFGIWLLLNYGTFAGLWAIALAFMTYQAARARRLPVGARRADRGRPRGRHHGPPPGGDPDRHRSAPGARRVLPALRLVVVSGRSTSTAATRGSSPRSGRRRRSTPARAG